MNNVIKRIAICLPFATLALQPLPSGAQVFPNKPIRIIVGVPAGAGPDVEARQLAALMTAELGQTVVVENRPGDAQLLAMGVVAKAAPDGYTLGGGQISNLAANPRLFDKPPYDVERDFVPVSLSIKHPWVLYVNAAVPVTTLQEFIALAKAKPNTITYASTGVGNLLHVSMEWFQTLTSTKLRHVPYGASPWMNDVLSGEVQSVMFPLITMVDHVKSGKLRALAISNGNERSAQVPNVLMFSEAGLGQFEVHAWAGLVAPAGTPSPIVEKLGAAAARAAQTPQYREFAAKIGATAVGSSPAEFDTFLKSERARWKKVIADAGIRME
jgi:tripartite-type tricarboxylate transporter receptor subunit TctC